MGFPRDSAVTAEEGGSVGFRTDGVLEGERWSWGRVWRGRGRLTGSVDLPEDLEDLNDLKELENEWR